MSTLLLVQVDRAEGLPSLGSDGSVDAYCSLELPGSAAQQSATLENTAAPQWNEHFIFPIPTDVPELELSVRVMDRDMDGGDDVLVGFVNVGFPPQPAINSPWTCEFSLQHEKIIVRRSRKNPGSYIARQKKGTEAEGEVAFTKDTKYPLGKLSLTITWLSVQELRDAGEGVIAAQAEIEEVTAQIEAKKVKLTQLQKTADTVAAVAAAAAAEGDGGDADASSAKVEELTGMAQSVEALEAAVAELEAVRSPELKPMPCGSPEAADGNGGGGGGSGGEAAAAGRRRFAGSSRLSLFRQPFSVGGATKVRV